MERTATDFTASFLGDDGLTFSSSHGFSNLKTGSDYLSIYVHNDVAEVTDYMVKEKLYKKQNESISDSFSLPCRM